jgi:7,8-dihydropterin-6-yl-methyl-4-(beta-D-ribofuranosyl)aminobenzene 5'-phosphate synthase
MHRRGFLKLGAVTGGALILGGLGRPGRVPVTAAQSAIPMVDRLVMTNVVDNVYDFFAKGGQVRDIQIQRTGLPFPSGSGPKLLAEHGLAYHLESFRGPERAEILLDFALTPGTLLNNYRAVRVDPSRANALILSHGHLDHYGALLDLVGAVPDWKARGITLYAGGEDTFCQRWVVTPNGQQLDYGQLDRPALEAGGVQVVLAPQPTVVVGHAITSGHIPRITNFETSPPAARLEAGPVGSDCAAKLHFPEGTLQVEPQPGELVQDIFWGEQATAYQVADRGLVVLSSCGHAGIINSIRQLQAVSGVDKIHAVVGGWHLAPAPDAVVAQTVAAFREINPDYLIPMHCTGSNTIAALQREMPEKLVLPSTGTRVVFGA